MESRETLIPMTVRLETVVSQALAVAAEAKGQEVADYAADILTDSVMGEVEKISHTDASRLRAELELKTMAIEKAKALTAEVLDPHVTLKVFQFIRTEPKPQDLYQRAIGGGPVDARGNHIKARINRTFGAAIKTAVGGMPRTVEGSVMKAQVTGELILSYTLLDPAPDRRRTK